MSSGRKFIYPATSPSTLSQDTSMVYMWPNVNSVKETFGHNNRHFSTELTPPICAGNEFRFWPPKRRHRRWRRRNNPIVVSQYRSYPALHRRIKLYANNMLAVPHILRNGRHLIWFPSFGISESRTFYLHFEPVPLQSAVRNFLYAITININPVPGSLILSLRRAIWERATTAGNNFGVCIHKAKR